MNFDSPTIVDEAGGGATSISAVHPDIVQTHILTRLDGPTLATAGCASIQLRALSTGDKLWRQICNDTWPSTADPLVQSLISSSRGGHRSFYSDSFPTLHHQRQPNRRRPPPTTSELISAVDIHYQNKLIFSKVHEMETVTGWFLCAPFRVDLLDHKETVPAPAVKFKAGEETSQLNFQDNLTLSWILIDPTQNRAANFSSLRPVSVDRHWLTGDIQIRYATTLTGDKRGELVQCGAVVTCGGKEGEELQVKEVSLQVEDMEGKNLSGRESLVILQEAIGAGERRKGKRGEVRERYEDYLKMKRERRERKERRERRLDTACMATGVTIFVAWVFFLLRRFS